LSTPLHPQKSNAEIHIGRSSRERPERRRAMSICVELTTAVRTATDIEHSGNGLVTGPRTADGTPRVRVFSGTDVHSVLAAMAAGCESDRGPARLAVLASGAEQFAARAGAARDWLLAAGRRPDGVAFRAAPVGGQIGFVFSGGSMSYPGMGR